MGAFRASLSGTLLAFVLSGSAPGQPRLPADFVYLRDIDPSIRQDIRYAGRDNFVGRPLPGYRAAECILRHPVALALRRAQAVVAAQHLSLKVYDCYRPTRAVSAMAHWAGGAGSATDTSRFYPGLHKEQLFAHGYISRYSAHSRGIAVDLTIVQRNAPPVPAFNPPARYGSCAGPADQRAPDDSLDMGTGFDCFDEKSHTRSQSISAAQRARRQILLRVMAQHGFRNYWREWWHFSFPAADTGTAFNFPIERR